ncbi:MAG: nucleoside monophosphate kinase [Parcubacteria group bacterium]
MKKLYVFIGPPGCGKGTQAGFLKKEKHFNSYSGGEILRAEVAKGTAIGKKADSYLQKGLLVPSEMILGFMLKRLASSKKPVVFDGYPRLLDQAETLDKYLVGKKIDATAILFDLPDAEVLERITGRRTCEKCGAIYHLKFNPPKKKNVCDKCGGKLFQRNDAKVSVVKNRLKVYHTQTEPVVGFYKKNKNYKFYKISSLGSIEKTRKQLLSAVGL